MSNGIKLHERLYRFGTMCVRCEGCTYGYKNADFELVCPIHKKYKFFTYSLGGLVQLGRALYEERLGLTESVSSVVYSCMSCGACGEMCAEVDYPDIMQLQHELRARLVEAGQVPYELTAVIEDLKKEDNMLGEAKADRGKWAEGLDVKDVTKEKAQVYFHAGCRYSFDKDLWPSVRGAVGLLKKAGVDVGIAGANETCCGGRAYEMGYQAELTKYAENNMELLKTAEIKTVVTACSDCYYAFKVLYDMTGKKGDVEVFHISEYLDRLIKEGRLMPSRNVDMTVTYHDPCHLGRKVEPWLRQKGIEEGQVYEPARSVLKSIPGLKLAEMKRNRANSWCCGAGGGVIDSNPEFTIETAIERIEEAKATGAEAMVTACSWCRRAFSDALEASKGTLKVIDYVELVEKAL